MQQNDEDRLIKRISVWKKVLKNYQIHIKEKWKNQIKGN
jgi:hypothetical protein